MTIVVNPASRAEQWMNALAEQLPAETLKLWPQIGEPSEVEFVLAWAMPTDDLVGFENLSHIFSLGAGVDQWRLLADDDRLRETEVVRLVDPAMSDEMAAYALHWVLHYQRSFDQMASLQVQHRFDQPSYVEAARSSIGIMGYGTIGRRVGQTFTDLGYPINAWSRSIPADQSDANVTRFSGYDELEDFLGASSAVVNVLPNTPETSGLLDQKRLAAFAEGSIFVNMGRGTVVRETDLLNALDNGPMRIAVLDVTDPEPPPASSPLFDHPQVRLTGHTAGATLISSAAEVIAANVHRIRAGDEPFPVFDFTRGY